MTRTKRSPTNLLIKERNAQVLLKIAEEPGIHPAKIADSLGMWPGHAGQILKKLRASGLVIYKQKRKELHHPGRIHRYTLSEKGEEAVKHLKPLIEIFNPGNFPEDAEAPAKAAEAEA